MALNETTKFFIGIHDDGQIEFRKTRIITDTVTDEKFERHHRQVLVPGQDVTSFPNKLKQICAVVWTPAVIAAYQAKVANQS